MSTKAIAELRDKLCRELDEINRHQELTQSMIDNSHKLASAIKNLYKVEMYEKYGNGEDSSQNGGSYHGDYTMDSYGYSNSGYDNGNSGRRGRDSMGRYTSRSNGRSWGEAKETMIQQLSDMLAQTDDPRRREIVRKARDELNEM